MSEEKIFCKESKSDLLSVSCGHLPLEDLSGKALLITGGTGLVGSALIRALMAANKKHLLGLTIYALVRNVQKAQDTLPCDDALILLEGSLEHMPQIGAPIHYIVHAASPTSSSYFIEHPAETINTAVCGTMNMLELAREKQVKGFVYLSSMEVYGDNLSDDPLYEDAPSRLTPLNVRNCYPLSKLMCENLCVSYAQEYGIPCMAIRLAQTFGPGIPAGENRVFAQFARAAINKTDISLATAGTTKQTYLYTSDAVSAIMTVLLRGEKGHIYNAANPATYCSIREMGELVAEKIAGGEISVFVNTSGQDPAKYPPAHKWNLSADKLMALGWTPTADLEEMYRQLIKYMKAL